MLHLVARAEELMEAVMDAERFAHALERKDVLFEPFDAEKYRLAAEAERQVIILVRRPALSYDMPRLRIDPDGGIDDDADARACEHFLERQRHLHRRIADDHAVQRRIVFKIALVRKEGDIALESGVFRKVERGTDAGESPADDHGTAMSGGMSVHMQAVYRA